MTRRPIAFLSYAHFDDDFDRGRLTELRKRLSGEVQAQTGEPFDIFQDREHLDWGQSWARVMGDLLDSVFFLIPVLSPSFFKSQACRGELERFLGRERHLRRDDLVLPIYYLDCEVLENREKRQGDQLAEELARRQPSDWRRLRFSDFTSLEVDRQIAGMATQIVRALRRGAHPDLFGASGASTSRRGSGERSEPSIWVVDALYRGDFSTVTEAVRAAEPGDKILIREGLYRESIRIDKPLEIVGEGDRDEIVLEAGDGTTLEIYAPIGKVSNLTLRLLSGDGPCVRLEEGFLAVKDCEISSLGGTCILVGLKAEAQILRNRIQGGRLCGVYIGGRASLESNEIHGSEGAGVIVAMVATVNLKANNLQTAGGPGVKFEVLGQGALEGNEISGNRGDGVQLDEGAAVELVSNKIHSNGGFGINATGLLFGSTRRNEIHQNAKGDLGGFALNWSGSVRFPETKQ